MDERCLSQQALAERVGVTQSTVWTWLQGNYRPNERTLQAVCRELGVTRSWLLKGRGSKYSEDQRRIAESPDTTYHSQPANLAPAKRTAKILENVHIILQNSNEQFLQVFESVVSAFTRPILERFRIERRTEKKLKVNLSELSEEQKAKLSQSMETKSSSGRSDKIDKTSGGSEQKSLASK